MEITQFNPLETGVVTIISQKKLKICFLSTRRIMIYVKGTNLQPNTYVLPIAKKLMCNQIDKYLK